MYGNATEINVVIRHTKFDMLSKISPVARICPFRDCVDGISTLSFEKAHIVIFKIIKDKQSKVLLRC